MKTQQYSLPKLQANRARLREIEDDNLKLSSRINSTKSQYNAKKYIHKSEFEAYLMHNIRQNSGRVQDCLPSDLDYVVKVLNKASSLRSMTKAASKNSEVRKMRLRRSLA